jgi:hypothetical protein
LGDISVLGSLQSLETLDLKYCKIEKFAEEIAKLKELRLLNLVGCTIKSDNPFEVIHRCPSLEELYFHWSFNDFCQEITLPALQRYQLIDDILTLYDFSLSKRVALQHERIEAEKASLLFTKLFPNKRSNKSRLAELKELHEVIRIIDNVRNYKTETANTNEDNICNNNCNCNCNDCSCTVLSSLLLMSYIYYIYDYLSVYMYLEMYLHRRNKALALSLCSFIITYSALSKLCNDMFSFV